MNKLPQKVLEFDKAFTRLLIEHGAGWDEHEAQIANAAILNRTLSVAVAGDLLAGKKDEELAQKYSVIVGMVIRSVQSKQGDLEKFLAKRGKKRVLQ